MSLEICSFLSYLRSAQEVDDNGLKLRLFFLLLTYLLWLRSVLTKSSVEQREMSHIFLPFTTRINSGALGTVVCVA